MSHRKLFLLLLYKFMFDKKKVMALESSKRESLVEEREKEHEGDGYSCPMCGSNENHAAGKVEGYLFISCENCEFVFSPQITPEYLSRLYAEGYHGPEDGAPATGWNDNPEFMDPAFEMLPKHRKWKILDFGTGQSLIPQRLRDDGHEVIAVDVVAPLKPHPDRLTGDIMELELPDNYFDLVYSFQVFEHLPQPRPILARLLQLTAEDGLVFIHTDMETPERKENKFENWWYVAPPDHCAFYKIKTFETFVENEVHKLAFADPKRIVLRKKS